MRKIYALLFSIIILTSACKKSPKEPLNPPTNTGTKTYLIKSITTSNGASNTVVTYTYDNENRIVGATYAGIADYKITYTNGKVTLVEKRDMNNNTTESLTYSYSGNSAFTLTDEVFGTQQVWQGEFNGGLVTKLTRVSPSGIPASLIYNYDAKGNLIKYQQLDGTTPVNTINFAYDDQKSAFSMVKDFDKSLYLDQYIQIYSAANNRTLSGSTNTTYTYNADGFPVSAVAITGSTTQKIQFDYIVK